MASIDSGVRKALRLDNDELKETVAISESKEIDLRKLLLKKNVTSLMEQFCFRPGDPGLLSIRDIVEALSASVF